MLAGRRPRFIRDRRSCWRQRSNSAQNPHFRLALSPPPEQGMWCLEHYHDRISLYTLQQITRANAPTGRLRRQGLRPQPARPLRPRRHTAGGWAVPRAASANRRRSHPPAGHTQFPWLRGAETRRSRNREWVPANFGLSLSSPTTDYFVGGSTELFVRGLQLVGCVHMGQFNERPTTGVNESKSRLIPTKI